VKRFPWHLAALLILALQALARPGHALQLKSYGVGNLTYHQVSSSEYLIASSPLLQIGGGASLGFSVGSLFVLESGLLYVSRKYSFKIVSASAEFTRAFRSLELPVLARVRVHKYASIAAGVYGAYSYGPVTQETTLSGGTTSTSELSFTDLAQNPFDYGAVLCAGAEYPVSEALAVLLDLRMGLGLANVSMMVGATGSYQYVQTLIGLRFGSAN
jgi:hypothetical protein